MTSWHLLVSGEIISAHWNFPLLSNDSFSGYIQVGLCVRKLSVSHQNQRFYAFYSVILFAENFIQSIFNAGTSFDGSLGLLLQSLSNRSINLFSFTQVMTFGCRCGSSFSAGPGPPVMNGIFTISHWTWASFLTKSCRLCLFSFKFIRRPFGFRFPASSGVSIETFLWKPLKNLPAESLGMLPSLFRFLWKRLFLGTAGSLSPAVFFLWLYYTIRLGVCLFAEPLNKLRVIRASYEWKNRWQIWYNIPVGCLCASDIFFCLNKPPGAAGR